MITTPEQRQAKVRAADRQIVRSVLNALILGGFSLSVFNGEDYPIKKSTDAEKIFAKMFQTDEEYLYAHTPGGKGRSWVRFIYGESGWDVICDYTTDLDRFIGEGSETQKLVDKLCEEL